MYHGKDNWWWFLLGFLYQETFITSQGQRTNCNYDKKLNIVHDRDIIALTFWIDSGAPKSFPPYIRNPHDVFPSDLSSLALSVNKDILSKIPVLLQNIIKIKNPWLMREEMRLRFSSAFFSVCSPGPVGKTFSPKAGSGFLTLWMERGVKIEVGFDLLDFLYAVLW